MLAPISWLKEYVDIDCSVNQLVKKLVGIGFEVEDIIYQDKKVNNVVVGKIVKVEQHPNADRLRVTQIDIGTKTIQVITNVPVVGGEVVAVSLDGAVLANGQVIKSGELRGVLSEGMLCGLEEVGLTEGDVDGQKKGDILRFAEGTKLGMNALQALGQDDVILDVAITANRPDCNSIYKLAREVAVCLNKECKNPHINYEISKDAGDISSLVSVEVKAPDLCPRYMAAGVKNVKIFESDPVIKHRLRAVGIRPINNIVDITNYVLTEIGQPMHSFDERELGGKKIVVRKANQGEHIISLDGKDNALTENMLVICDANKPVAVAGIMGGEESGIKDDTSAVVFESAKFARDSVRRTSRALNLRSDSSARFEKGIDFASQELGLKRALTMIYESKSGDITSGIIDVKVDYKTVKDISFTTKDIKDILGCNVPKKSLINILSKLGIETSENGKVITAHIKEDREDIYGVNDIAEEFIRVYGYKHIQPTLFAYSPLTKGGKLAKISNVDHAKDILVSMGLSEAITYSFTSPKYVEKLGLDPDTKLIKIINPLGEDLSVMRTVLAHNMLETLAFNISHFNKKAKLFEIAKVYIPNELPLKDLPKEEEKLVIGMYGEGDFYDLKGYLDGLCQALGVEPTYAKKQVSYLHIGRSASISVCGQEIGVLGEVHPDVAEKYGVDEQRLYIAEISLEELFKCINPTTKFKAFSKFPPIDRDLAVVVDKKVVAGDMLAAIKNGKIANLADANIFDVYEGDKIGKDKKSIALSFTFTSNERTLKDDEIQEAMDKILTILSRKFKAKIRG